MKRWFLLLIILGLVCGGVWIRRHATHPGPNTPLQHTEAQDAMPQPENAMPQPNLTAVRQPERNSGKTPTSDAPRKPSGEPPHPALQEPLMAAIQVDDAPNSVKPIVHKQNSLASRLRVLSGLTTVLEHDEYEALIAMVLEGYAGHQLDNDQKLVLHNNVLTRLLEESGANTRYRDLVCTVFNNHERDVFERDYALQHLGRWYEQLEHDDLAEHTLLSAINESGNSVAGTALLALYNHRLKYTDADREPLAHAALQIAGAPYRDVSCNTALHICAQLGLEQITPIAMELALDKKASIPHRAAAISVIGDLGSHEAESALNALKKEEDRRLKPAVEAALQKLKQRLNNG